MRPAKIAKMIEEVKTSNLSEGVRDQLIYVLECASLSETDVGYLAMYPYERPGPPINNRISAKLRKAGYLERNPGQKVDRCTQKGTDAVTWFKEKGWYKPHIIWGTKGDF